jgi:hypothetical protein
MGTPGLMISKRRRIRHDASNDDGDAKIHRNGHQLKSCHASIYTYIYGNPNPMNIYL